MLQETKLKFKAQLVEYYNKCASKMTCLLDIDETIDDIYEKPKLTLKKTEKGTTTETNIPEVSQLFSTSDGPMAEKIIVEGEPGTGKTSLCKKIVDDWRKVNEKGEQEPIKSNLSKFEFVFYIILCHVNTESEIKAMIVKHILKKIDSDYENEHSLLGEILKSEHCLLLLDGLDEWRGKMPHVETSWRKCTLLITTRPYKLAELKVIPMQVGKHVKLKGVQNPEKLVLKVIRKLEEFHKTNKDPESCIKDLQDKQLWHFSKKIPVVLVHSVWLWQKSKLRENMSLSTIYREIIDERWNEMCDKENHYTDPQALYEVLSAIALNKLLTKHEDESLVFNIDGIQLEKFTQYKDASLKSGILSAINVPGERVPKYQFIHKTFQEYLAAVFLSSRGSALSASCEHVKRIYLDHRNESVFALSQLFLFLCSLNPDAATEFSKVLNELFTENCEKEGSAEEARTFQQMILRGYEEAERNGHIGAEFCLQHIVLEKGLTENHMSKLKLCLEDKRKSNLVSLRITEESDLTSALQYCGDPTVLDLEICKNLKFVALVEVSYEDINQLNLNGLLECIIQFSNYKAASKVMTSLQSSDLRRLKSLVLKNVCFDCKAMDIFSKLECVKNISLAWCKASQPKDSHLDLYHLRHLKQLTLLELDVTDVVNLQMLNLHTLEIDFRTQQRAQKSIATLIPKGDGSLTTVRVGTHATLSYLKLKNVHMPSEVFMRLVSMVIQLGHKANCTLSNCTVDEDIIQLQEEVGNQPALQVVAPQPTAYEKCILFSSVTMSAGMFRRLVSVVTQSGHPVQFEVKECTIEEDIKQLQKEIGSLTALQVVAPQPASPDYQTHIWLSNVTISAGMFWRLVSVVIQPGHSVYFTLDRCTIAEDIEQLEEEFGNQLLHKMVATQPASTDYKTCIRLFGIAMSAGMFRRLVSVVIQSEHSVECLVSECTLDEDIKQLHEEVGNKSALQVVTQQPASPDYKINIFLMNMTMSARMYMRLVSAVKLSGHSVDFEVNECTIHDDIKQLQEELENPTALQVVASQPPSTDYKKDIKLKSVVLPAGVLGRLVSVVTNSGRLVDCEIEYCTIDPVEEVKKLQLEMEEQPAVHVNGFSRCERGWCITYKSNV
ncbi:uncharacterized protein LOC128229761 isoform X2 [Mya arenaria]|uniref:uncharacterized protein LOC128229761 isoform X2 n=1 Tax=Mya arenaria TaxID=6604 RepID=UPI0022DF2193|nr:uncharacterized protein LOC128229761 isoform X2 [Mya arenaria]